MDHGYIVEYHGYMIYHLYSLPSDQWDKFMTNGTNGY
jgi:hypothetical protein